jgi:predicted acylesterase/phospholipase RssA
VKRALRPLGVLACLVFLSGCVIVGDSLDQFRWRFLTVPYFVFDNAPDYNKPEQPAVMENRTNIAIAISGGGLRSAVFGAGVLEQLAYLPGPGGQGNLLESTDIISGVSGGSLAAAYYSLYKPARFENDQQICEFFQHFKSQMTVNLFARGWVHYLSHPWEAALKYNTRYRFVQTLANTMDQYLFHGATFDDLHAKELSGAAPVTLLNSTSLDTGQKFIFTNLEVCKNINVDPGQLLEHLPSVAPNSDIPGLTAIAQLASAPIYNSIGFDTINSDIGMFRLASAIAASSAYPILPGPAALIDYTNNGYVHLGDGGVNDNSGVDAVVQAYLNKLSTSRAAKRLVVININAVSPVIPSRNGDPNGYVSSITYGERANTILGTRAQTFSTVLYNIPRSVKVVTINLAECPSAKDLLLSMSRGEVDEDEMLDILAAAGEAVQMSRAAIEAAVSGQAVAQSE